MECKTCQETRNDDNCKDRRRQEMIDEIKCLNFAVIELGLYLDTHRR